MKKAASSGPYAGMERPDIFLAKIKDGKTFRLGTSSGKEIVGISYDKKKEILSYYEKNNKKKMGTATRSQIFKDKDFGGGSGSGGGAADTARTECLQCYYCSYVFNKAKKEITHADIEDLKKTAQYAHTDISLKNAWEKGPSDWIETDVYIKTANKLWKSIKGRTSGNVHFHRGSTFMSNLYKAKKKCQKIDKDSGDPQAPGSFSDDKWNPGDIWMSTLSPSSQPLKDFTDSWGKLNAEVLRLAGGGVKGSGKIQLLGISLKRIAKTQKEAKLQEFSTPEMIKQRPSYKWESYSYGKTGNFFDSQDIYVTISGKQVQFRTFSGDTSWQGEIKGIAAAGGKIGGGNVNFYCNKIFNKTFFKPVRNGEKVLLNEFKNSSYGYDSKLYELYKKHRTGGRNTKPEIPLNKFKSMLNEQTSNFTNSKMICMLFLDIVMGGTQKQRNALATELFRYASSDTDQSSYFVKLY